MPDKNPDISKKRKSRKPSEEIDLEAPTQMAKIMEYVAIVGGIITLIGGVDMTFSNSYSVDWSPAGRTSPGSTGRSTARPLSFSDSFFYQSP